jgi:hypothetical protein
LMDATGSMSHLIQKAKNTVGKMFERASGILTEKGINPDAFEMQFAVYRNYDCRAEKLLQVSSWETKPDNLRAFMDTIAAEGGTWEPEAVEIGLWHANREADDGGVSQVILIGDAPANDEKLVDLGRKKYLGEVYWQTTKFVEKTHYLREIESLKQKGIRVHGFFVARSAKVDFERIAKETGGRSEFLDVNSSSGADALTDLVTEEVLRSVGGNENGAALVAAYQSKYPKSYR